MDPGNFVKCVCLSLSNKITVKALMWEVHGYFPLHFTFFNSKTQPPPTHLHIFLLKLLKCHPCIRNKEIIVFLKDTTRHV